MWKEWTKMKSFRKFNININNFPAGSRIDRLVELLKYEDLQGFSATKDDPKAQKIYLKKLRYQASRLLSSLTKLGYSSIDIDNILKYADTAQIVKEIIYTSSKAKTLNLSYFKPKYVIKALERNWNIPTLFYIVEKFEQHKLDENPEFANFDKLFTYPSFSDKHAKNLVEILIQFKYHEIQVTQDQVIRYFNANRPDSEDLKNLYYGLLISKEKNLDLKINDFIKGIIDKRQPRALATTYAKIKDNNLAISKERYMTMGIEQSIIDRIVNFMILAKKHGLIIELEDIVKQYSAGANVFDVLRILIKLHENGFTQINFGYLTKLAIFKVDLSKVIAAFNYAKKNLDFDQFIKAIDRILPIRKSNSDESFNLVNFAKSLHIGTSVFGLDWDTILNDYISGLDVWGIIDMMNYAKSQGIALNYAVAKILNAQGKLKEVIYNTLTPFEITTDYIHVTTKDNIEIKVKLVLLVTYNLGNYFKGTGEEYLIRLVKAIFIDEVQKHYNHDEIVQNIDKISKNILLHLTPPENGGIEENNLSQFLKVNKYKLIKVLIPHIEFVKETFKEIEKVKHHYNAQKELIDLELERLRAEIKIKEAWAQSPDLRYLILKDENDEPLYRHSIDQQEENKEQP